jgi:hypothetical protein
MRVYELVKILHAEHAASPSHRGRETAAFLSLKACRILIEQELATCLISAILK